MCTNQSNTDVDDSKNTSILVLDDEYDIVKLVSGNLQTIGLKVCSFTDPLSALEHFNSDPKEDYHNAVISDVRMPSMSGYEFVNHIKKINPKVKVILMSSSEIDEEEFSDLLPNVKIDAFIQKPFSLNTLRNIVKKNGSSNSQYV